mmetsp:Transcript_24206/g.65442  ORF Transcript_24206/g.65442 Transcript_24206/m.65442 type:complete len:237 (-) Transcript_24206:16-726(-)
MRITLASASAAGSGTTTTSPPENGRGGRRRKVRAVHNPLRAKLDARVGGAGVLTSTLTSAARGLGRSWPVARRRRARFLNGLVRVRSLLSGRARPRGRRWIGYGHQIRQGEIESREDGAVPRRPLPLPLLLLPLLPERLSLPRLLLRLLRLLWWPRHGALLASRVLQHRTNEHVSRSHRLHHRLDHRLHHRLRPRYLGHRTIGVLHRSEGRLAPAATAPYGLAPPNRIPLPLSPSQ